MSPCTEKGSYEGSCCCNCRWQGFLVKHPWNKDPLFKGSIMETIGFVCTVGIIDPKYRGVVFSDRKHGMCEMWEERK